MTSKKNSASFPWEKLAYCDYIAAMFVVDSEWTRPQHSGTDSNLDKNKDNGPNTGSDLSVQADFVRDCAAYADGVEDYFKQLRGAIKKNPGNGGDISKDGNSDSIFSEPERVDSFLYQPYSCVPYSSSDSLQLVLLDDFDPIHHLAGRTCTAIENITLAFCPDVERLMGDETPGMFSNLEKWYEKDDGRRREEDLPSDPNDVVPCFPLQETSPFLAFGKFKLDGLSVLDESMLVQQAVFRTLIDCTNKISEHLGQLADGNVGTKEEQRRVLNLGISRKDIEYTRCALLDLQGVEEVGLLIASPNISLATTILKYARSITFSKLLQTDKKYYGGQMTQLFDNSAVHQNIFSRPFQTKNNGSGTSKSVTEHMAPSHVFRWTRTTVAIATRAFNDPASLVNNCNGFIEANVEFDISPGHQKKVEEQIKKAASECGVSGKEDKDSRLPFAPDDYYRINLGQSDLSFSHTLSGFQSTGSLVPVKLVVEWVSRFSKEFSGDNLSPQGRHVINMMTRLTVPIPRVKDAAGDDIGGDVDDAHLSTLTKLLREIQNNLFNLSGLRRGSHGEKQKLKNHPVRLDVNLLREKIIDYGMPLPLRRTIEYLYQNFAVYLADPFLFDLVIDLVDTYATLYSVLTKHLPDYYDEHKDKEFEQGVADQIASVVEAIQDATSHRLAKAHPGDEFRETAVDFRGQLNQILFAADAPLKCGLGIARKYATKDDRENSSEVKNRETMGSLTRVAFAPGASAKSLNLGIENKAQLAYLDVDVPHVLHVGSYGDYLHEAFHLAFNKIKQADTDEELFDPIRKSVETDRIGEIFSLLMTHILVFGYDWRAFVGSHLVSYLKSLYIQRNNRTISIAQITEVLIRLFVVVDAVGGNSGKYAPDEMPELGSKKLSTDWKPSSDSDEDIKERFESFVVQICPLFPDYEQLWKEESSAARIYCTNQFGWLYPLLRKDMPQIWQYAINIHNAYLNDDVVRDGLDISKSIFDECGIVDVINGKLSSGQPIYGLLPQSESPDKRSFVLDPTYIACRSLYTYLRTITQAMPKESGDPGKEIHLIRDTADRQSIIYNQSNIDNPRRWNNYQIDRGRPSLFSPIPNERRKRIHRQVALIKTMWNLSSRFRARRFNEEILQPAVLLQNVKPE